MEKSLEKRYAAAIRSWIAILLMTLFISCCLSGCDDGGGELLGGTDEGAAAAAFVLTLPELKPPVEQATPSSLKASTAGGGRRLDGGGRRLSLCRGLENDGPDCKTEIEMIKGRLFSQGPQDFTWRLGMVDNRVQELRNRSTSGSGSCINETAMLWSPPTLPGSQEFPMYFNCYEKMNQGAGSTSTADLRVYFGIKDDFVYVAEIQDPGNQANGMIGAVLAKITMDSSLVHVWQIMLTTDRQKASLLEIKAVREGDAAFNEIVSRDLEISYASSEAGSSSIGCGVRMLISNGTVFASGVFADQDCSNQQQAKSLGGAQSSVCLGVTSLTEDDGLDCEQLSHSLKEITSAQAAAYVTDADNMVKNFGDIAALGLSSFVAGSNGTSNASTAP